jgi:uncharacterized membrane protein HdeD (DUF308 family)
MSAVVVDTAQPSMPTWAFILEGVVLILFGLAAIAWPGLTLYTFTILFAFYALISGVVAVITGIIHIGRGWQSIARILLGGLFIAAGSYILNNPGISAATLVLFVAFSFLIRGIIEIVVAASEDTGHRALSVIGGIVAIIVGLILLRHPIGGGVAYVWVLGIYALISGPIAIAIGLGAGRDNEEVE